MAKKEKPPNLQYVLLLCCAVLCFPMGLLIGESKRQVPEPEPKKLVIELLIEIQKIVDCNKIDGEIGPETKRKVNAQCEKDKPILFNRYAAPYHTPSGAPRLMREK